MILLISSKFDVTTNEVIKWLNHFKASFVRFNYENYSSLDNFSINDNETSIKINDINLNKVNKIWNRRGKFKCLPLILNKTGNLLTYLKKEEDSLVKSIEKFAKTNLDYIGSYKDEVENYKLDHLIIARDCGLKIPNSMVTNNKDDLKLFFNSNKGEIITKDIRYPIFITSEDYKISSAGTFKVNKRMINKLGNHFAPIYVQECINKEFEIRIFFFKEKLFSMSIFSQNDDKTKIDYRNYNEEIPNRCVPFKLPKEVKKNVLKFIKLSGLNTGSIDMIFSSNKEYIFIEVNPMGQFDWLSKNCNYYIEEYIAKYLFS